MELAFGERKQLSYQLYPANARGTVSWLSSNPEAVIITSTGMLIGRRDGTATITATTNNGKIATCQVMTKKPHFYFVAWMADGTTAYYSIEEEKPQITFDKENIVVSTSTTTATYAGINVVRFTLADANAGPLPDWSGIEPVYSSPEKPRPERTDGHLLLQGLKCGESAAVYDAGGHLLHLQHADGEGHLTIDMQAFPQGVYIVKAANNSYKFIKK